MFIIDGNIGSDITGCVILKSRSKNTIFFWEYTKLLYQSMEIYVFIIDGNIGADFTGCIILTIVAEI